MEKSAGQGSPGKKVEGTYEGEDEGTYEGTYGTFAVDNMGDGECVVRMETQCRNALLRLHGSPC